MKDIVQGRQARMIIMPLVIDAADASPAITVGSTEATVADTNTGISTVTFARAFARAPVITATCVTATGDVLIPTLRSVTSAGFILETSDDAGTLTDGITHVHVIGFESASER